MNSLPRRLLFGAVLAALPAAAIAQSAAYPTKPVRLIVAFAPGGLIDSTGRLAGAALTAVKPAQGQQQGQ